MHTALQDDLIWYMYINAWAWYGTLIIISADWDSGNCDMEDLSLDEFFFITTFFFNV